MTSHAELRDRLLRLVAMFVVFTRNKRKAGKERKMEKDKERERHTGWQLRRITTKR